MKLLYLVAKAEYFLSHRLALAKEAKANGYRVGVATTEFPKEKLSDLEGMEIFPIRFQRGNIGLLSEIITILDILKTFLKYRPKIVHNVALKPAIYGTMIARLFGVPVVNAINGFGYIFTSNHLRAKLLRPLVVFALKVILNHRSVRVIVQNAEDFNDCQVLLPKAQVFLILGSGVDTKGFFPVVNQGTFTFTLAARMLWSKGIAEFVEAAQVFKQQHPKEQVRFLLVGCPDEQNPESIPLDTLEAWSREGVVEWLGHVEDIQSIYANSDVAVLPSYREGMPKSLLEAMACGLPIITSDARGCADIVRESNGIKVPVSDVPGLVQAFEKCFFDRSLCKKMGAQGRIDAEKVYSIENINRQILDLYQSG